MRTWLLVPMTSVWLGACSDSAPPGDLGTMECPIVDGGCPEACHAVRALEYDEDGQCLRENLVIACSNAVGGGGAAGCYANTTTGALVFVSGEAFAEPYFRGWRLCTEPERARITGAPECS